MSGIKFDTSGFAKATKVLQDGAKRNTQQYGRTLAQRYAHKAKSDAPWVDRRGNARMRLYGASTAIGSSVRVEMGGTAPNYKRGALSAADYMEYLEFAHGGKYATIFPTAEAISADVLQNFGDAALRGKMRVNIVRNRKELNQRRKEILKNSSLSVQYMLAETIRMWAWLEDRSVFNR